MHPVSRSLFSRTVPTAARLLAGASRPAIRINSRLNMSFTVARGGGGFSMDSCVSRPFSGVSRDDGKEDEEDDEAEQIFGAGDPTYGEWPDSDSGSEDVEADGPFTLTDEERQVFLQGTHVRDDDKEYWDGVDTMFDGFNVGQALMRRDLPLKNAKVALANDSSSTTQQEKLDPQAVVDMLSRRRLATYIIDHLTTNKVVKGGNMHSMSSLVVVGNGRGCAGFGVGKASSMEDSIAIASSLAYRDMQSMDLFGGTTPYIDMKAHVNGSTVEIRTRDLGGRRRCSPMMFLLCEAVGLRNVIVKCHGNRNRFSMVQAFFKALRYHFTSDDIAMKRGLRLFHHTHRHAKVNYRH